MIKPFVSTEAWRLLSTHCDWPSEWCTSIFIIFFVICFAPTADTCYRKTHRLCQWCRKQFSRGGGQGRKTAIYTAYICVCGTYEQGPRPPPPVPTSLYIVQQLKTKSCKKGVLTNPWKEQYFHAVAEIFLSSISFLSYIVDRLCARARLYPCMP